MGAIYEHQLQSSVRRLGAKRDLFSSTLYEKRVYYARCVSTIYASPVETNNRQRGNCM